MSARLDTDAGPRAGAARRLDVALLHYTAPPIVGGVERVLGRQAGLMADAGHSVRIVAGRGGSPHPRVKFVTLPLADSLHPEVVRASEELAAGTVPADFEDLVERVHVALRAATLGADVVVAHNVASLGQNLALTAALRRLAEEADAPRPAGARPVISGPPRLILWHHDLAWTMARYQPRLHEGWPWSLLREPWPGALNVTISEYRQAELAALLGVDAGTIPVVPGGVDLPDLPALEPLAGCDPLLLAPVRITPRKNVELAMAVVAAMRDRGRPAGLVVSGPVDPHNAIEHSYRTELLAARRRLNLESAVLLLADTADGSPSDAELATLYQRADALILPSRDEGFGLPILEAAAARLPIFCSDLGSLRALGGAAATYFSPDGDPAEIAEIILRRLDSEPAAVLARRVRTEYAWPRIYGRYVEPLLQRVAASVAVV